MSGSEEEDTVLRRLSRMGVVCSLESMEEEDGDGVLGLLDAFFRRRIPPDLLQKSSKTCPLACQVV